MNTTPQNQQTGWTIHDAIINEGAEARQQKTVSELRREALQLLNVEDKSATYWDLHMSNSEKRVILQAASLPTESEFINRRFKAWTLADQKLIKEAAKRASDWANNLRVS